MAEVKRIQRSMNKFYQFLSKTELIEADFASDMKQMMKDDID